MEFMDGHNESLSANLLAQHLYSQIDEEGNRHVMLDDITDHRRNESAIDKSNEFITMSNGVKRRRETTRMAIVMPMERWKHKLGSTKRHETIVPDSSHRVCNCQSDRR